jgi:long-chain acyl-CoA synthetase
MSQPTRDVIAERAEIDQAVAGKTIPGVFADTVARYADQEALTWGAGDSRQALTWKQYRERVRDATLGLARFGFWPGDFGLVMARTRPEHLIADLGFVHAGGHSVTLYNTLAPEQIEYIANHCGATFAVVEDRGFLNKFLAIRDRLPNLRRIIVIDGDVAGTDGWAVGWRELLQAGRIAALADPGAFDAMWRRVKADDIVALIYTSGTTGNPKGVTYTNANILWTCESARLLASYEPGWRWVSYLPLAHVAERFTTHWGGIYNAFLVHLVPDSSGLLPALVQMRPQAFVGVPRVWEKFQAGVRLGIAAEPDEQRRAAVQAALDAGLHYVEYQQRDETPPPELAAAVERFAPVYALLRGKIGLDQCRIAYTSTAPIPLDVLLFFASIGLPLIEVWGMSELTGPATGNPLDRIKLGTVGVSLPGVEVKLSEDGEVMVRGGNVMPAYYRDPQRTAETLDGDGWLYSGDIATVDDEGYFRIVDRKKELIITSGGKNISPAYVEAQLKHSPLVGQAIAVGDGHNYVTALIVLDQETAPVWAKAHGIVMSSPSELATHPAIVEAVRTAVADANTHLSQAEQVKRFTILPEEWTAESEELTPTLKLKRRVIHRKYGRDIEAMYVDEPGGYGVALRPAPVAETVP